jgi:hypothetical protein
VRELVVTHDSVATPDNVWRVLTDTELDLGRSYTTEARSHGAYYRSTHLVEAIEGGSRITMAFGAEPTSALSKVFSVTIVRLFDSYTRKALAKDLTDIATAAEGSP